MQKVCYCEDRSVLRWRHEDSIILFLGFYANECMTRRRSNSASPNTNANLVDAKVFWCECKSCLMWRRVNSISRCLASMLRDAKKSKMFVSSSVAETRLLSDTSLRLQPNIEHERTNPNFEVINIFIQIRTEGSLPHCGTLIHKQNNKFYRRNPVSSDCVKSHKKRAMARRQISPTWPPPAYLYGTPSPGHILQNQISTKGRKGYLMTCLRSPLDWQHPWSIRHSAPRPHPSRSRQSLGHHEPHCSKETTNTIQGPGNMFFFASPTPNSWADS